MKLLNIILTVAIIEICVEMCVAYDFNNSAYDYYESYSADPERFLVELSSSRKALDVLFQSSNQTNLLVFSPLEENYDYWDLDQVYYEISNKFKSQGSLLTYSQVVEIRNTLGVLKEKIDEVLTGRGNYLFKQLIPLRSNLDCAVGRKATNDFFSVVLRSWRIQYFCTYCIPNMWYSLLSVDFDKKNCTLKECIVSLLNTNKIAVGKEENNGSQQVFQIKLDLVYLLSITYDYLFDLLCPNRNMDTPCPIIEEHVCKELSTQSILQLSQQIQIRSKANPPATSQDMMKLLDLLTQLAKISNSFAEVARLTTVTYGKEMLENYMGIVDTAIGSASVNAWKEATPTTSENQFKKILLNSETYVGLFTKIILGNTQGSTTDALNKSTMSVKMGRYSNNTLSKKVEFSFNGATIWTDPLINEFDNKTDVFVYALHYTTWKETLQNIQKTSNTNVTFDQVKSSKYLVGKGGIISLSSTTKTQKQSVPVSYKIKFENELYSGENMLRRCLSCEYLDNQHNWMSNGCHVTAADDEGVTCHCNHTTNFAAFMMPHNPEYNITNDQETWLNIMEYVGSTLSIVALLAAVTAFCLVKESIRNDRLKAHMNLVVALLFVHAIQLVTDYAVYCNICCVVTTIATHYFLLSSFMWMLVEGIFLYLYVVQVFVHSKLESHWWMYFIGWGIPAIIVAISAVFGVTSDRYVQHVLAHSDDHCEAHQLLYPPLESPRQFEACWLDVSSGMVWSFIGPALSVIFINAVILCKVIQVLVKLSERSKSMKPFDARHQIGGRSGGSSNLSYRPKLRQTRLKDSVIEYKRKSSDQFNSSIIETEEVILHGSAISNTSRPNSRSSSQVYLQNRVMERPKMSPTSLAGDRNFLADIRTAVKGAIVLLPLLGIPWICGMLGYKSFALTIIFVIFNSVQGVAIFLVYCVFNNEVRRGVQRQINLYRINNEHSRRGRTSSTSSLKAAFNRGLLRNWRRRSTAVSTLSNHI